MIEGKRRSFPMSQQTWALWGEWARASKREIARLDDLEFIESIRKADAAPPEASFNNCAAMLAWLNG